MKRILCAVSAAIFVIFFGASAQATCPYTFDTSGIANGQTADATPVANNFNYLIACPNFTGSVGIGTLATTTPLVIVPPSDIASIFVNNDGTQGHMGAITFNSGYSQKWTIGVGDTIGAARNFIISESSGGDYFPQYVFSSGAGSANAALDMLNDAGTSSIRLSTYQDSYLVSSGNFGIGTTTPAVALAVVGNVRVGTSGTNGCVQNFAGTALVGTCSSDAALKTVRGNVTGVLSKLADLQLVKFSWNEIAQKEYHDSPSVLNTGFIAQNVEAKFPELVSLDGKGYRQLDYTTLSLYGLEAIKELKQESDGRAAEIARLKVQLAAQGERLARIERSLAAVGEKTAEIQNLKRRISQLERKPETRTAQYQVLTAH